MHLFHGFTRVQQMYDLIRRFVLRGKIRRALARFHCTFKMTRDVTRGMRLKKKKIELRGSRNALSALLKTNENFDVVASDSRDHKAISAGALHRSRRENTGAAFLIGRRREIRTHGSVSETLKIIGAIRGLAVERARPFIRCVSSFGFSSDLYLPLSGCAKYIFMIVYSSVSL